MEFQKTFNAKIKATATLSVQLGNNRDTKLVTIPQYSNLDIMKKVASTKNGFLSEIVRAMRNEDLGKPKDTCKHFLQTLACHKDFQQAF